MMRLTMFDDQDRKLNSIWAALTGPDKHLKIVRKKLFVRVDDHIIIKNKTCFHPSFKKRICMTCGREANNNNTYASVVYHTSIPFKYIHKDLRYTKGEVARLKGINTKDMISLRKLHLVLDLDHTLLHSVCRDELKENELFLWNNDLKRVAMVEGLSYVSYIQRLTKIRPYVQKFLEEASNLFDMHVYTMACRDYAKEMTRLLDPEGVYFASRIVSREDCTRHRKKSLDVILGKENATLILDDTRDVWPNHKENLIGIKKYFYFAAGLSEYKINGQSSAQMKRSGESEDDTSLSYVLEILKKVHTMFFEEHDRRRTLETDVRDILKRVGCGSIQFNPF